MSSAGGLVRRLSTAVVLVITLDTMDLKFESVNEILKCDHSNETNEQYFAIALFITLVQDGSNI